MTDEQARTTPLARSATVATDTGEDTTTATVRGEQVREGINDEQGLSGKGPLQRSASNVDTPSTRGGVTPLERERRMVAFYSEDMALHTPPGDLKGVSEVKERGDAILSALRESMDELHMDLFEPDDHTEAVILNVHTEDLHDFLKIAFERYREQCAQESGEEVTYLQNDSFANAYLTNARALGHVREVLENKSYDILFATGLFLSDAATPITAGTYQAAYSAAQCAVSAVRALFFSKKRTVRRISSLPIKKANPEKLGEVLPTVSYALCRPPGHHASSALAGGFCFFNNVAIAAQYAIDNGFQVAIMDVDFHHGNGTQRIFYERSVPFVSLHCNPLQEYPFWTGFADETGQGDGAGYNLNIPLPVGTDGASFLAALEGKALPFLGKRAIDILLISFGSDTARDDPEGGFLLDPEDYVAMGASIKAAFPLTRICVVQEGGYGLNILGHNVVSFLKGLL